MPVRRLTKCEASRCSKPSTDKTVYNYFCVVKTEFNFKFLSNLDIFYLYTYIIDLIHSILSCDYLNV